MNAGSARTISVNARIFRRHFNERCILVRLDKSVDTAGVLLREKSLVHGTEHLHADEGSENRDCQDDRLMMQYPFSERSYPRSNPLNVPSESR